MLFLLFSLIYTLFLCLIIIFKKILLKSFLVIRD
jgi:hypothetical protein